MSIVCVVSCVSVFIWLVICFVSSSFEFVWHSIRCIACVSNVGIGDMVPVISQLILDLVSGVNVFGLVGVFVLFGVGCFVGCVYVGHGPMLSFWVYCFIVEGGESVLGFGGGGETMGGL